MQRNNYFFQQTTLQSLLTSLVICCCFLFGNNTSAQMFEKAYQSQKNHSGYSVLSVENATTGGYIMAGTAFDAGVPEPAPSQINVTQVDGNGGTIWNKNYDLGSAFARCFNINHTPDGYIISGMVEFGGNYQACLIHIDFNGNVIDSRIYYDNILGMNSQALHTVFSYHDFSFTTVGFVNDDNYDNTGSKQSFVFRSDYNLNIMCDKFFDTPQIAGVPGADYDMAEHVTDLQGTGYFITGSINAPTNFNKQGVLALRIDNDCNLVANGSFSSSNSTEAGVSAVFDGQRVHLLSNNSAIHNFELTTFGPNLNILSHVGFSPCCDNYAGFSLRESPNNSNNLIIAGHIRTQDFVDGTGTVSIDNTPPFLVEVEKGSGNPVTAGAFGTYYQVVNNFNGTVGYRDYGGFYQPFTGQQPFIFSPEMLTTTQNGEYALVSHRTNFTNELDIELIKTDMFGKATDCQEEIIFSPFQQGYTNYDNINTNIGLVATFPFVSEMDMIPSERDVCNSNTYPCDDPAIYGAVALGLTDLGGGSAEAALTLPAGASLVSWDIDFGDGSPVNTYGTTPVNHIYSLAGTYTVCAWGFYIINNVECYFQLCETIFIESNPCTNVGFTYSANPTLYSYDFVANYTGSLTLVSVDWDFGDGNTGTGSIVTHTYANSGFYSVCATFTLVDSAGATYTCVVCYSLNAEHVCDPSSVGLNLADLGGNVVETDLVLPPGASLISWNIDFGDGSPVNTYAAAPINYTYASSGTYLVCAWGFYVVNNVECDFQICDEIVIGDNNPCDDAHFTYSPSPTAPYTYDFVGTYSGGLTLINVDWIFDDGNTGSGNPITHTYATPGTYYVCAIFTFADAAGNTFVCEWCEEIIVDYICDPSAVGLDLTDIGNGDVEAGVMLPPGSSSLVSWTVDFGDGNPPNTYGYSPVTYNYAAAGSYVVCAWGTYIINDMECDFQVCDEVIVNLEPCDPSAVGLDLTDIGNGDVEAGVMLPPGSSSLVSWTVDFGDGNPSITYGYSPVTYNYAVAGSYIVCAWGTYIINNVECTFQVCDEIIIQETYTPCSSNLVINGDFENGNDGSFMAGTLPFVPTCQVESYAVVNNATDKCGNISVFDHTNPPLGLFLDIDGYSGAPGDVWCQNVTVTSFTNYTFSFWATDFNVTDMNPNINMTVNGTVINAVSVNTDNWTQYTGTWNSGGTSGTIAICLNQTNFIGVGVDYGIDDIEFCPSSQSEPCDEANLGMNFFPNGLELGVSPMFDTSVVDAWEIIFGDGYSTGVNTGFPYSAIHNYDMGGFYTVCLVVWITDPFTGAQTVCEICEEVYIDPCNTNPPLDFDINVNGSNVDVCPIITTPIPPGAISWNWNFDDGNLINDNMPNCQTNVYQSGGVYTICLTVVYEMNDGTLMECVVCKEVTIEDSCDILSVPTGLTSTINWPMVTLAWNSVPGAVQYQLAGRKAGGTTKIFPTQATTSRTFNGGIQPNTTYQWAVRAFCADGTRTDWSSIATFTTPNAKNGSTANQVADPFETNEVALTAKAYPNPAVNNLTVEYTLNENVWNTNNDVNVTIIDLLGRTVMSQKVTNESSNNKVELDVSQLSTGTYILQVDNGMDKHVEKLSILH
ncbi:MAG: PKD domain-containing protein [Chitinophagales bacterium]